MQHLPFCIFFSGIGHMREEKFTNARGHMRARAVPGIIPNIHMFFISLCVQEYKSALKI